MQVTSLKARRPTRPSKVATSATLMSSSRFTLASRSISSAGSLPHPTRPRGFVSTNAVFRTHARPMWTLATSQLVISSTGTAADGTSSSLIGKPSSYCLARTRANHIYVTLLDGMVTLSLQNRWSPELPHLPMRTTEAQTMARTRTCQPLNPPIPQLP